MDDVVLSLYNYASNQREEYLLLKLFKTALEEEIECVLSSSQLLPSNAKLKSDLKNISIAVLM